MIARVGRNVPKRRGAVRCLAGHCRVLGAVGLSFIPEVGHATGLEWIEEDWSGGRFSAVFGIDPDASPGELVVESQPHDLTLFLTTRSPLGAGTGSGPYTDVAAFLPDPGDPFALLLLVGNTPHQRGGAEIVRYELVTDTMTLDVELYEDGGHRMELAFDGVHVPGADTTWPADTGNVYAYDPGSRAWKSRIGVLPGVTHLFDIEEFAGSLLVAGRTTAQGVIFGSIDGGVTWTERYRESPSKVLGLGRFEDRLFALVDHTRIRVFDDPACSGYSEMMLPNAAPVEYPIPILERHDGRLYLTTFRQLYVLEQSEGPWVELPLPVREGQSEFNVVYPVPIVWQDGYLYAAGWDGSGDGTDALSLWRTEDEVNWSVVDAEIAGPDPYVQGVGPNIRSLGLWHGRLFLGEGRMKQSDLPARVYAATCIASGVLDSRPHDFGAALETVFLCWDAMVPPGTSLRFKVRSSPTEAALLDATFVGPDGSPSSYFAESGESLLLSGIDHRWMQYRVLAESSDDGRLSPILTRLVLASETCDPAVAVGDDIPTGESATITVHPQPMRSQAVIRVSLSGTDPVEIGVFTAAGQHVRTLTSTPGANSDVRTVTWDGRDERGHVTPAGVYMVRVRSEHGSASRRLVKLH